MKSIQELIYDKLVELTQDVIFLQLSIQPYGEQNKNIKNQVVKQIMFKPKAVYLGRETAYVLFKNIENGLNIGFENNQHCVIFNGVKLPLFIIDKVEHFDLSVETL